MAPCHHGGVPDRTASTREADIRRTRPLLVSLAVPAAVLLGCAAPQPADPPPAAAGTAPVVQVDPAAAVDLAGQGDVTVVDVRTPEEYAEGHLAGAVNVDVSAEDFAARISELDPAGTYVVYCRSGARSAAAADRMVELGFTDVRDAGALADLLDAGGTASS
ncbi:rhodanese-like domain-containing protein [Klenkia sp. LSe6-5]|uniref:Rhodanese-like domain-containing protein n=1 Tax=Klenkia sesuvii TaxID=3103137 RepID=A0ABU8DQS0_9ACTN